MQKRLEFFQKCGILIVYELVQISALRGERSKKMGNDFYVAKKRNTWVRVIKTILIIAAIAFVAYKIYDKFFKKKVQQEVLQTGENGDAAIAETSEAAAE